MESEPPKWSSVTMATINRMTPNITSKAFDPDWFLLRERFERVDALEAEHAALLARMKNLEQLNVDACDDDTKIRNLCRRIIGIKATDGNGHKVPPIVEVVEKAIGQIREHARQALRLARDCHGGSEEYNALAERINK